MTSRVRRIVDRVATYDREARYAMRVTLSAGIAFAIADALHLAQPTWAVISAIIVARASTGGVLKAGRDRVLGTLAGAVLGIAMALGRPLGVPELVLILVGVGLLAFAAALRKQFLAAPIALVIVLSSEPAADSSLGTAGHRLIEVGLGAAVAILVALLPWGKGLQPKAGKTDAD